MRPKLSSRYTNSRRFFFFGSRPNATRMQRVSKKKKKYALPLERDDINVRGHGVNVRGRPYWPTTRTEIKGYVQLHIIFTRRRYL